MSEYGISTARNDAHLARSSALEHIEEVLGRDLILGIILGDTMVDIVTVGGIDDDTGCRVGGIVRDIVVHHHNDARNGLGGSMNHSVELEYHSQN